MLLSNKYNKENLSSNKLHLGEKLFLFGILLPSALPLGESFYLVILFH